MIALASKVLDLVGKVVPDRDAANRLAHEIATLAERQAHELAKYQNETNKAEAAHKLMMDELNGETAMLFISGLEEHQ